MTRLQLFSRAGITLAGILALLTSINASAAINPVSLATLQVAHEKMPSERMVDGTIEAINQATVSAQTSGRITDIFYDVNDFVPSGAVIMRVRGTQQRASMQQAQASLQEADALNAQAQQQFNRIEGLYKEKVATRQEYEQALANRDAGAARLESARAAVEAAKEGFGYTEVRAPYAGIVTKRLVQVGETVQPGTPLMSGVSLQYLRVNLDLPQSIVEKVRAIRKAAIYVNDQRVDATSFTLFPEANTDTHTFHARANLPANATDLHPGMFVKVGVVVGEAEKLLIPQTAVVTRSEVTAVYVVHDKQPLLRQVRLGQRFNDRIEVLAGLTDGEAIALDPVAASRVITP